MLKLAVVKMFAIMFVVGGLGAGVSACHTVEGVGKDVGTAGKGISRGAQRTRDAM